MCCLFVWVTPTHTCENVSSQEQGFVYFVLYVSEHREQRLSCSKCSRDVLNEYEKHVNSKWVLKLNSADSGCSHQESPRSAGGRRPCEHVDSMPFYWSQGQRQLEKHPTYNVLTANKMRWEEGHGRISRHFCPGFKEKSRPPLASAGSSPHRYEHGAQSQKMTSSASRICVQVKAGSQTGGGVERVGSHNLGSRDSLGKQIQDAEDGYRT